MCATRRCPRVGGSTVGGGSGAASRRVPAGPVFEQRGAARLHPRRAQRRSSPADASSRAPAHALSRARLPRWCTRLRRRPRRLLRCLARPHGRSRAPLRPVRQRAGLPVPPVGRCRTPGCTSCCRGTGQPPGTRPQSHRPALTSPYRSQPAESAGAGLPSRSTHRTNTLRLTAGKSNGKVSMLNRRVESGSRCRRLTLAPLAAYP